MKEYLEKQADDSYKLVMRGVVKKDDDIEVPEWANYAYDNGQSVYFSMGGLDSPHPLLLWQRHVQPEELPFVDSPPEFEHGFGASSLNDQYAEIEQVRKHRHYFKDVSNIAEIDVYAVLKLFEVTDPCLQHIVKKALCAGKRGHKDMMEDLQNIVDTAIRAVELNS